jgi:tetratricopeptide (TPR) repeat protein
VAPPPAAAFDPYGEVDLPTVGGASMHEPPAISGLELDDPEPPPSGPPALADLEIGLDLPAVSSGKSQAPKPPALAFGELDLDLPAASPSKPARPAAPSGVAAPRQSPAIDELDLPAMSAASRSSGAVAAPSGADSFDLDLPSPAAELDLPSPSADLPVRSGAGKAPSGGVDLPARAPAGGRGPGLPSPARRGADLPSPAADLPALGGAGLPVVGGPGLPAVGGPGLPQVGGAGLPQAGGAGLPQAGGAGLPQVGRAGLASPPLGAPGLSSSVPPPASSIPPSPDLRAPGSPSFESTKPSAGMERIAPPPPALHGADLFGELDLPPLDAPSSSRRESGAPAGGQVVRQAGGGINFGEVNLDGDEAGSSAVDAELGTSRRSRVDDEDMEFGAIPQEASRDESAVPAAALAARDASVQAAPAPAAPALKATAKPASKRRARIIAGAFAATVIAGGALAMVPSLGPFGAYWITDQLKQGEYAELVLRTATDAQKQLRSDTHAAAATAQRGVEAAHRRAARVSALAAYAAYLGYLRELRFGTEPAVRARAQVMLDELADTSDEDIPQLELARAARAAVQGQLARARQVLSGRLRSKRTDVDALVLSAELELKARDPKAALRAWQEVLKLEPGARAEFGMARAHRAAGARDDVARHAEAALKHNPEHVGSKILLAELLWQDKRDEAGTLKLLQAVTAAGAPASAQELVDAHTLTGHVNLARSRISHAEAAYGQALRIDPKSAGALNGLGDALYRAGRYSEALARFEAAAQADPDEIGAKLGVAKTKLALERIRDSVDMLKKLREQHPKSSLVNYWFGRVQEAAGDRQQAEIAYRAAIASGQSSDAVVDAYVALALLLNQLGRAEDAQKALSEAKDKYKDSPALYKAFGELALSQSRNGAAIEAFESALKLDPDDVVAKYRLGVALRLERRFDDAAKMFDAVAAVDREYPGLALERGLLFEASGKSAEALKAYEAALAKAPTDPDLMLRVGCGKTAAGRPEQAVELLRKVLIQRPNSAETNHCLGRALLLEGKNLAEALRLLERAVELDPHRAEHHLYVGWAANEAGRVARAESALAQALSLDKGLGDAYWQRGVLRYRQGAVKDAVEDLRRAIELNPARFEAHAALADSLYDLGREPDAIREWQQAVAAQPDNPTWRFRYGKLLAVNHRNAEAREHLGKAIELAEQEQPRPRWTWEAHHLLARALGNAKEAIRHWEEFLKLGPRDSPYRGEAKATLEKLGKPWSGP